MFAMDTGIFSKFMLAIGAIDQPVAWLNSSEHIWLKMWGWSTWKGLGWGAIMYLAAIAGIDQELYEAAQVDGAGRWAKIRYITLPGLLPTFFVLLMLSISNILNNGMDQYLAFQNPMNKNTIEVLDLYVYNITIASRRHHPVFLRHRHRHSENLCVRHASVRCQLCIQEAPGRVHHVRRWER